MSSEQLIRDRLNSTFGLNLKKPSINYVSFDAYDEKYIVEIKDRRSHYEKQMIEFNKYSFNSCYSRIKNKKFLYVIAIHQKIYIFNITELNNDGYDFGWEWRELPKTTDFDNNQIIDKFVGYIDIEKSKAVI